MKKLIIILVFLVVCVNAFGSYPQIANVYGRKTVSLNGEWKGFADLQQTGLYNFHGKEENTGKRYFADADYMMDRTKLIEYSFDSADNINVPADWNTQKEKWYYYEGNMWYRKMFNLQPSAGKRYFLYFGAINYKSVCSLNNVILGTHIGGFTPFNYEITDYIRKGENSLVVNVDNLRGKSEVPTERFDWWNYGGITRDVMVIETPETFIRDYSISLDPDNIKKIDVKLVIDGPHKVQDVTVEIPELKIRKTVSSGPDGVAEFSICAKPKLWSPESPKLYKVKMTSGDDCVVDEIGFRTIKVDGTQILLNGKSIFLKGVAVHEESVGENPGRFCDEKNARKLISIAKEMNCNFLRLTHYPHNEIMVRMAEKQGILVWDEIPCYWAIDWENEVTYKNAESQLCEMIDRDKNRANVIIWSVANETPKGDARLKFLTGLISKARNMDHTRLVAAALLTNYIDKKESRITVDDDLAAFTDLLCFNEYVGWYDGDPSHCAEMKWEFPVKKPVIITEFGGGARFDLNGDSSHRFTEQHLAEIYEAQIDMFSRVPYLSGTCPWVLKDFRSPRRLLPGIQDEYNRKGLVDENGNKKRAYFIMQKFYSEK